MNRTTSVLTISASILGAALILQPEPATYADRDDEKPTTQTMEAAQAPREIEAELDNVNSEGELVQHWLDVAADIDPEKAERLRHVCDHNPEEFRRIMKQSGTRLMGLAELKRDDPDLYQLKLSELRIESQVQASADQLAEAIRNGEETAALEEDLHRWVSMQVAHSIRARGDYLLRLKEHMKRLEEDIENDARNFNKTVQARYEKELARSQAMASAAE